MRTHLVENYQALRDSAPCLSRAATLPKATKSELGRGAHLKTPSSANHTAAASQPTGRIAKAASWLHLSRVSPPYTRRKDSPTLIPRDQVSEGEGTRCYTVEAKGNYYAMIPGNGGRENIAFLVQLTTSRISHHAQLVHTLLKVIIHSHSIPPLVLFLSQG